MAFDGSTSGSRRSGFNAAAGADNGAANRNSDGWNSDYFDNWNQWNGQWNQYDQDIDNNGGQRVHRNSLGYGYQDGGMMMHRNSLMGNMGEPMMRRDSMGYGYNYFDMGGYGQQQQGSPMNTNQGGMNQNQAITPNQQQEDLTLSDEERLDYLAARAHAAQMLAQEESKRLQDNLRRMEARRKRGGMNDKTIKATGGGDVGFGGDGGFQMSHNQGSGQMMQQDNFMQMPNHQNNIQQMQMMQNNMQQACQDRYNPNFQMNMMNSMNNGNMNNPNMNMPNNANMNNTNVQNSDTNKSNAPNNAMPNQANNLNSSNMNSNSSNTTTNNNKLDTNTTNTNSNPVQSKDDDLFERSRQNNFQMMRRNSMDMMGYNNNNPGMMNMGHFQNNFMMPPPNMMMGYTMNMAHTNNNATNNATQPEKKRKRPTISDPTELPVIPPSPKKEYITIRRPLSAYNIFFSEMRQVLVNQDETKKEATDDNDTSSSADPKDQTKDNANNENNSSPPPQKQDMKDFTKSLMAKRLNASATRRPHRKTHGAIGFTTLVKTISRKWKALPEEEKLKYKELAQLDRERYKRDKAAMQKMEREEAKRVKKMARQVHCGGMEEGEGRGDDA